MKTVILLRHAKSSWDDPSLADRDRPLNGRGRKAARAMAGYLEKTMSPPDIILCSTAERTRQTLAALKNWLGKKAEIDLEPTLYLASPETMLDLVRKAPKSAGSILLIGHNPGTEDLARLLLGDEARGEPEAIARLAEKFPTGALAEIRFDADKWKGVKPGRGRLERFVWPRHLIGK